MTPTESGGAGAEEDRLIAAMAAWRAQGIEGFDVMLAASALHQAVKAIDANIDAVLRPFNITAPRNSILTRLYWAEGQQLTLGEIAHVLRLHPTSVTSAVDRLERDGLIERAPHPTDRRATLARLTEKGRTLVDRSLPRMIEAKMGMPDADADLLRRLALLMREVRVAARDTVADERAYTEYMGEA